MVGMPWESGSQQGQKAFGMHWSGGGGKDRGAQGSRGDFKMIDRMLSVCAPQPQVTVQAMKCLLKEYG